jgi:phosphoribosylglycinamide formyltransferase-1
MEIKKRIVVLASGRGSNFCALADAIQKKQIPNAQIIALISNRKEAPALLEANSRNVPQHIIASKDYRTAKGFDRDSYEAKLLETLLELKPDLILLAGYMLVLGKKIVEAFPRKIINIHPSLLPKFRGLQAQKQALESGDSITGCTVHWVTERLDEGETILQNPCPILPGDTVETLSQRLLPLEHKTYIAAVKKLIEGLN